MKNCIYEYSLNRRCLKIAEDKITYPLDIVSYLRAIGIHEHEQEHFIVMFLDSKNKIKGYSTVSIGLIDRTCLHAREVFRNAILMGSSSIAIAHNHPSGDPTPSQNDIIVTKSLVDSGKIIDIKIIDHIIVAENNKYFSFKERGIL